jgi:hypothetical protein
LLFSLLFIIFYFVFIHSFTTSSSLLTLIGFESTSWKPDFMKKELLPMTAFAVRAIIGTVLA